MLVPALAMARTPSSTGSTQNALNALDTRDVTLPKRLWSWLAKRASEQDCSIDEAVAALIDAHRHPEQAAPAETADAEPAPSSSAGDAYAQNDGTPRTQSGGSETDDTAADRLRRMSDRLSELRDMDTKERAADEREAAHEVPAPEDRLRATPSGDGAASPDASPPSDTEALMDEAMSALNQASDTAEREAADLHEQESDGASMFDVVRDEEA